VVQGLVSSSLPHPFLSHYTRLSLSWMDSDYAASKWAGGVHYAALQASSDEQHHTLAVPRGVVHWTSS